MKNIKWLWTKRDNQIAETELKLSKLLTQRLAERPEVSLHMLYMSRPIQQEVGGILKTLEQTIGKEVKARTDSYRHPDGSRTVTVEIEPRYP